MSNIKCHILGQSDRRWAVAWAVESAMPLWQNWASEVAREKHSAHHLSNCTRKYLLSFDGICVNDKTFLQRVKSRPNGIIIFMTF